MSSVTKESKKDGETASLFGIPMKWVSLLMLVAQTVSVVFAMRLSKTRHTVDGLQYLNSTAVFFSELLKLICSFLFLTHEKGSVDQAFRVANEHLTRSFIDTAKIAVPGALYTLQNNLLFASVANLSAAVYQVTYQLKILTTAILSVIILGKALGRTKWSSLFMLFAGVALIQLPRGEAAEKHHEGGNPMIGLAAVLSACVTSGFAGVFLEKLLKQTDASIWVRNIQLALFGAGLGLVGCFMKDAEAIRQNGFLQGYSPLVWSVIFLQAVGGLVVAAVLKYADNILKCFGNAVSIVLSCILSGVLLQEFTPDLLFVVGTILVLVATTIYNLGLPTSIQRMLTQQMGSAMKSKVDTSERATDSQDLKSQNV